MGAAQNQGTVVDLDLQHPYLRNCKTRTTENGTDLLATIPAQFPTYKAWKKQIDSLSTSLATSDYILLPIGHRFDEGGVCSTSGQLHLEYEYYPRLLSSEIAIRKRQGRRFTEGELWYLLYALTMSKDSLSEDGEVIGDAHPRNIFLNDIGEVKVACLRSWPGQVSNYRRAVLEEEWGYLAPEDIERLKLGAMDNQINTESQIFSIGLVLLSTSILQLQQDIYEMKEREFLEDIFFSKLGKFQHDSLYSQIFRAVISNLLEIEPLKRMNLHELKAFLEKHTENIIAKKPLKIDNVGKKLQITINIMLKTVRQGVTTEKPSQQPNIVAQSPNVVKGGMRVSGQKILKNINFEERPPLSNFPQPNVRSQTSIQNNYHQKPPIINQSNSSAFYMKPPFPPPHVVPIIVNNEQPHRPTINKIFSSASIGPIITKTESTKIQSPPKYKPFESITSKGQVQQISPSKVQQTKILKQQPSIEVIAQEYKQVKTTQEIKETGQKPTITQIWIGQETSIGQLNLLMETMREGFDHNSLINPKYEPECIQKPLQVRQVLRNSNDIQQQVQEVQEVKEQNEESPQDESGHNQSKMSKKSETPISHSLMKQSEVHKCQAEKPQANNDSSLLKDSARISQHEKALQKQSNNHVQNKGNQSLRQSQSKNSETSKQSNKIEVVQLQANNQTKPLSPLVKVWGMKMGLTKNKNEANPSQNTTNIKEVEVSSQKVAVKLFQVSTAAIQTDKTLAPNIRQQRCLLQSQIARRQSQIINDISFKNRQKHEEHEVKSKDDASLLHPSEPKQESPNIILQNNDYILIQDESKHTNVQESHSQVRDTNFIKQSIQQQESEIIQYHTYADIVTEGTFEQCWQEILIFLRDPTDYTNKIDPNRVKMRILDDRWSLRVGPGVFDILLNKEEGKFLLKNCEESRCEGQMLGGVYKDEDKKHRIWFNSAYYYKGSKIPSKEIIEECLKRCQANIAKLKK